MITVNYNIIKEIFDPDRLKNEIYEYLQSVIQNEISKNELMDDNLISDCVDELYEL